MAFSAALDNPKIVKSLPYPTTAPGENANPLPFQIVTKRDNSDRQVIGKLNQGVKNIPPENQVVYERISRAALGTSSKSRYRARSACARARDTPMAISDMFAGTYPKSTPRACQVSAVT